MSTDAIDEAADNGHVVVALEGELAVFRAHELRLQFLGALEAATGSMLEVDLSAVTEMDGAGMQLLLALQREAATRQTPLVLTDPSVAVRDAMGVGGMIINDRAITLSGEHDA